MVGVKVNILAVKPCYEEDYCYIIYGTMRHNTMEKVSCPQMQAFHVENTDRNAAKGVTT